MRAVFNLGDIAGKQSADTWVLTNTDNWLGAYEWIHEPAEIRKVMKENEMNCAWVIPSSKHELLLVPTEHGNRETMEIMHREVQERAVNPEDRLSDNVWYIDEVAFHMTLELKGAK